jgi:uncharacterized protein (TIGR02284 family)
LACNLHNEWANDSVTNHAVLLEDTTMAERTEREVLHHLIEVCKDGERGYRAAADHVSDPKLKTLFGELAAERKRFADELTPHLHRLGGLPDGGSSTAALHRSWMALKGLVPGSHNHQLIAEAERGEHFALDVYEEALNGMLPPTVTDIVEAQREAISKANERVRTYDMGYAAS